MKKSYSWLFLIVILLLCGCNRENKQDKDLLQADTAPFTYENAGEADALAVDANGLLYVCKAVWEEEEDTGPVPASEYVYKPIKQMISVYDLEGNCMESRKLEFGNGDCWCMLAGEDKLYCAVYHSNYGCYVLYEIDTMQWTVTEKVKLEGYSDIAYLEVVGEHIYVLGRYKKPLRMDYEDDTSLEYSYNRIARVSLADSQPELELMNVELPVAIYETDRDNLMIYRYVDGVNFGFLEFDPQEVTLAEAGWKNIDGNINELGGCDTGFVYSKFQIDGEFLYYGTPDGTEAQVYPEEVRLNRPVEYQKGFVFFANRRDGKVYRICIEETRQDNPPIQFLQMELTQDFPYGCGFQMEKRIVTDQELALKVLAQDKDFDMFLMSSRSPSSDSVRKNGVFYPLNEVEGVEEYIDACFPYLSELARNEEGDIWMVPVMLAVPGIVYHKEYCAGQDVDFSSMDFEEMLMFTRKTRETNQSFADISFYVLKEELFGQYLSRYDTFDTELFRNYAKTLKSIGDTTWLMESKVVEELSYGGDISPEIEARTPWLTGGELPEFYYFYNVYSDTLDALQKNAGERDELGMLGMPKLEDGMKNFGTLTFMAVNPESQNLSAVLDYISAFSKYMLGKQDSFILADKASYTDTPFTKEWYDLYAGGSVYFGVDSEVFTGVFNDYLEDEIDLEAAIAEMERRRKLNLEE
ncbi:MAG: hypothetical protein J6J44_09855 [Lachnospiraceae bacterium]|nr:hypothetical protein [Lachnospiraceae bacterium]